MGLTRFIRNSFTLQNIAAWAICHISPEIYHNVEKLAAIRKAFAYTHLECVEGDYLEFGVFEGTSLVGAMNAYNALNESVPCRFIGFDSFEGLRPDKLYDRPHPLFKDKEFSTIYERVMKRIRRYQKKNDVRIVRGYFQDTLSPNTFEQLGVAKVRVSLIDCDLKSSAREVFLYSSRYWQAGTVLIIDDFFNYRGDSNAGVCGAFKEFTAAYPRFSSRDYGLFGNGGVIKIVTSPTGADITSSVKSDN